MLPSPNVEQEPDLLSNQLFHKGWKCGHENCRRSSEETRIFLDLIHEKNITAIVDGKQWWNAIILKDLRKEMLT